MTDDHKEPLSDDIQEALKKLNLEDVDFLRPLTPDDVLYVLSRCPFLQMVSLGDSEPLPDVELITAKSNWIIHHYGDAMSSSPGKYLFQGGDFRLKLKDNDDDDGGDGDGGIVNPGKGTIWKQAFDTAQEMMALAQKLGWTRVKIVDGHPIMQWAAWMYAQDEKMHLEGYEPDQEAHDKRRRFKRTDVEEMALNIRPARM
ncbi:hypothetical protein [Candidiatus Paracoxiella cheracis]|uniref:hypothetical protein n=1 Tax=Candidiatus Paracoxiella cheracis TaxID=3405120 RepID=UPI003BF5F67C